MLNPKPRTIYTAPVSVGSVRKYPYDINGRFQSFDTIGWCGQVNPLPGPVPASTLADNLPASLPANYPPLTTKNTYNAGDQITIYWAHPLPHDDPNVGTAAKPIFNYGVRFAINYTATDMVVLNKPTIAASTTKSPVGQFNGHIEQGWGLDPFQLANLPWLPNATFTLPAGKTCNNCVLQMWIDALSDGGGYIDCADIKIGAQVNGGGVATTPPVTTTKPGTVSGPTTILVISGPIVPSVTTTTGGGNGNGNGNNNGGGVLPPPADGGNDGTVTGDQIYTQAQVGNHANPADCWTILDGMVYDITKLIDVHPGGGVIIDYCGLDASSIFSNSHQANEAADRALLDSKYKIGTLQITTQPGASGGRTNQATTTTSMTSSLLLLFTSFAASIVLML